MTSHHERIPSASTVRNRRKRLLVLATGVFAALAIALLLALFMARAVFHITSTNAVLYLLRQADGRLQVTNHLRPDESDNIYGMVDISCLFNWFAHTGAHLAGVGNIELTWNGPDGDGVIKEFRPDGTELLVVLSRFSTDAGTAQGLFIGGDLPFGDSQRISDASKNNTGMAYHNGSRWIHIWCTLNEGLSLRGADGVYGPEKWNYLGSRVLRSENAEVMLESSHDLTVMTRDGKPLRLAMRRTIQKRLGEDYLLLKLEFSNTGTAALSYTYELGDEPWVGDFYRGSKGNVGWADGVLYKYESEVKPFEHSFAGFWDIGNDAVNEQGDFTGYADFIEWLSSPPDHVYFANNFDYRAVNRKKTLSSRNNRVLGLVWLDQQLRPGEKKEYLVALGMAKQDRRASANMPAKPAVRRVMNP